MLWLQLGPSRSYAEVTRLSGVTEAAIRATAKRWDWPARAAAFDAHHLNPLHHLAGDGDVAERMAEHRHRLSDYRQRCEEMGRAQLDAARALMQALLKSLEDMEERGEVFPVRAFPGIATAAASLGFAGQILEAKALGVEQLLHTMADLMSDPTLDEGVQQKAPPCGPPLSDV